MAKCTFCGNVIEQGTGKIFIQKEGKVLNFCSSKCEKHQLKLGRKFLETRWSKRFKKEKKEGD